MGLTEICNCWENKSTRRSHSAGCSGLRANRDAGRALRFSQSTSEQEIRQWAYEIYLKRGGQDTAGKFKQAAAYFQPACDIRHDAEACYWSGLSYERLADMRIPFGCSTETKAHEYDRKAAALAPARRAYRDALYDFLLNADCSRSTLREADAILMATPPSGPDYASMRARLDEQRRLHASADERLASLLLIVPRAAYRVTTAAEVR
jgi:hypothetical protein